MPSWLPCCMLYKTPIPEPSLCSVVQGQGHGYLHSPDQIVVGLCQRKALAGNQPGLLLSLMPALPSSSSCGWGLCFSQQIQAIPRSSHACSHPFLRAMHINHLVLPLPESCPQLLVPPHLSSPSCSLRVAAASEVHTLVTLTSPTCASPSCHHLTSSWNCILGFELSLFLFS
jgi:hypothetical protein